MVSLDSEYLLHVHYFRRFWMIFAILILIYCNDNNFFGGGGELLPLKEHCLSEVSQKALKLSVNYDCSTENTSENFSEKALLNMEAICLVKRGERLAADCILVLEIRS